MSYPATRPPLSEAAWALRYFPSETAKKWAVLYATWCGTARDHVVVGSGIGAGKVRGLFTVCGNLQRPLTAEMLRGSPGRAAPG